MAPRLLEASATEAGVDLQAAPVVIAASVRVGVAAAKALAGAIGAALSWFDPRPREAFLEAFMNDLQTKYGNFNIIIFREGRWLQNPQGIIPDGRQEIKFDGRGPDKQFQLLIFSGPGQFERSGDGGFPNWRFSGWFTREGDRIVTFKQSPKA